YTTMGGAWQQRQWKTLPAGLSGTQITAPLPSEKPVTFFLTATTRAGLITSTPYVEIDASENPACLPKGKLEQDFYDWEARHTAVLEAKDRIHPDIVMIGDSITHLWGGEPVEPKGNRGSKAWQ